jgi:hypothetical protein
MKLIVKYIFLTRWYQIWINKPSFHIDVLFLRTPCNWANILLGAVILSTHKPTNLAAALQIDSCTEQNRIKFIYILDPQHS